MPINHFDAKFDRLLRKFVKGKPIFKQKILKTLEQFANNPKHPSLHLEKLSGNDIWTIRLDQKNRLFFVWSDEKDTAIFFYIGPHDAYRTIKK